MSRPVLLTFDVFGTVVDWRSGLGLGDDAFDRVVDLQGALEQERFRPYREIVAESLVRVLGLEPASARRIGEQAGLWPLYPDSRDALARLLRIAPCVATTNSDREHGDQVQRQLGFRLSAWLCAEEMGVYKPSPEVWRIASRRLGVEPGRHWWHVSAYGDYDLEQARRFGLTCVYVERPHARSGPADLTVKSLADLADVLYSPTFE